MWQKWIYFRLYKERMTAIRNEKTDKILFCYGYDCLDHIVRIEGKGQKAAALYDK